MEPKEAAEYYVLFRLSRLGCEVSPGANPHADVIACSPRGTRVSLLRVRCWHRGSWGMELQGSRRDVRNQAYVFVDFATDAEDPHCYVVPGAVVAAYRSVRRSWPETVTEVRELGEYRDAWNMLGLFRSESTRTASSASPSASPP